LALKVGYIIVQAFVYTRDEMKMLFPRLSLYIIRCKDNPDNDLDDKLHF